MAMLIPEWVLGIIFQIIGSFFSNLGINVQKYAHLQREQLLATDPIKSQPYYKTPMWLLGFGLFCFGEIFAGIAMGYTTQSLLAVLSSYSLILNGLFSMAFSGTKITFNYIKSSLIIMLGSILVILSTTHHKQQYTVADLGHLFTSWPFLLFLLFLILFLSALFVIRSVIPKDPTLLTTISAFMACISVLLAKCTMQLIKKSFLDDENLMNQFTLSIWPWIIPCFFAIFAALNVHFMNLALQVSSTTHVYPLYYSTSTILVIINGMLFFQEYLWFTFVQSIVFSMGVSICITGITSLQEEEQIHQYEILPHDDSPGEDVFDSVVNAYPPDFFLKQEVAQAHHLGLLSSAGGSEMSSVFGGGMNGLGGHFGMTPGGGLSSDYSTYQTKDDGQFFSPKYNMAVSTTTSPLPGSGTPPPPPPPSTFSIQQQNQQRQRVKTTPKKTTANTPGILSPIQSTATTGPNSARSQRGLWDDLNQTERERLQADAERLQPTTTQQPQSHSGFQNPIFMAKEVSPNTPNSSLPTTTPSSSLYDEPGIQINYSQILDPEQGHQQTHHQAQFDQQAKQQTAQPVAANKKSKTRVVRQAGQGSRLASFFESQSNMQ